MPTIHHADIFRPPIPIERYDASASSSGKPRECVIRIPQTRRHRGTVHNPRASLSSDTTDFAGLVTFYSTLLFSCSQDARLNTQKLPGKPREAVRCPSQALLNTCLVPFLTTAASVSYHLDIRKYLSGVNGRRTEHIRQDRRLSSSKHVCSGGHPNPRRSTAIVHVNHFDVCNSGARTR